MSSSDTSITPVEEAPSSASPSSSPAPSATPVSTTASTSKPASKPTFAQSAWTKTKFAVKKFLDISDKIGEGIAWVLGIAEPRFYEENLLANQLEIEELRAKKELEELQKKKELEKQPIELKIVSDPEPQAESPKEDASCAVVPQETTLVSEAPKEEITVVSTSE